MKALLTGLLFTGCAACSYAYPVGFPGDTTRKEKAIVCASAFHAGCGTATGQCGVPSNLAGHEEASLDYIEKFSERRRDYLLRMYNQGKKFFPKVQKIFKNMKCRMSSVCCLPWKADSMHRPFLLQAPLVTGRSWMWLPGSTACLLPSAKKLLKQT